ncbi:MAG: hypothetical protein OXU71_08135, partial [Gammaproteobacteria bacterium]|nr:hypothetical protein [Gammaproteobacteria bacterium]
FERVKYRNIGTVNSAVAGINAVNSAVAGINAVNSAVAGINTVNSGGAGIRVGIRRSSFAHEKPHHSHRPSR